MKFATLNGLKDKLRFININEGLTEGGTTMIMWIAIQENDGDCYNLITKTKSELLKKLKQETSHYSEAYQMDVDCSNIFALLENVLGEGGGKNEFMGKRLQKFLIKYKGGSHNTYSYTFESVSLKKI